MALPAVSLHIYGEEEVKPALPEMTLKLIKRPNGVVLAAVSPKTGEPLWFILAILNNGAVFLYKGLSSTLGLDVDSAGRMRLADSPVAESAV